MKIGLSVVIYNYYHANLFQLLNELSVLDVNIYVVNTGNPIIQETINFTYYEIDNIGYGSANNIAIKQSIQDGNDFHIVCNPDVAFSYEDIVSMIDYMNSDNEIAVVQPRIVDEEGIEQYLVRRIPSPKDLFLRRFNPFYKEGKFECRDFSFDKPANFPILSGSFLVFRTEIFNKKYFFDSRFFLYLEDYDLVRRIHMKYKTIYYPYVTITHLHNKESYKTIKGLFRHIVSAIKYFNKWGWFFDHQRRKINESLTKHIREIDHND